MGRKRRKEYITITCIFCGDELEIRKEHQENRSYCTDKECRMKAKEHRINGPRINWDFIVESYNVIKGANYENYLQLLIDLYQNMGSKPIAKILGVSYSTILSELKYYGIPIRSRGGPNNVGKNRSPIHRVSH